MRITVVSKNYGSQSINTDTFSPHLVSTGSTIFKIVEHLFNDWYDHHTQPGAPMRKDIEGMYYGEGDQPAIYGKRGAIIGGIENLIEACQEMDKPIVILNTKQISNLDIECAFE